MLLIPLLLAIPATFSQAIRSNDTLFSFDLNTTFTSCIGADIASNLVLPQNDTFGSLSRGERLRVDTKPLAVLMIQNIEHVSKAVECAYSLGIKPVVRSGGHSYESFSSVTGSMIIDISHCDDVKTTDNDTVAIIEAGARLGNIYSRLWNNHSQVTINAGSCPTVGIGGLTLGGGYGYTSRKYGLAADTVISMNVVLYNGTKLQVNATSNSDLFWAMRGGGGGNFGIVTHFSFQTFKMPQVSMQLIQYNDSSQFAHFLTKFQTHFPSAPRELTAHFTIGNTYLSMMVHYLGSMVDLDALMNQYGMYDTTNINVNRNANCSGLGARTFINWDLGCNNLGMLDVPQIISKDKKEYSKTKSDYSTQVFSMETNQMIVDTFGNVPAGKKGWMEFEAYGGIFDDHDSSFTPYPHRKGTLFSMQYSINLDPGESESSPSYEWLRGLEQKLKPFVNGRHYQNYPDLDHGNNFGVGYYGEENFRRLQTIKKIYDPNNVFQNPQSIPLP